MSQEIEVTVPNIGDFDGVEIIEVLVATGDVVAAEDSLITVESDKASMEIPSSHSGTVTSVAVSVGDTVSEGSLILTLEAEASSASAAQPETAAPETSPVEATPAEAASPAPTAATFDGESDQHAQLVVLGSGPGGYTAAFRAADLGLNVILVERYDNIGGVCLNVGCIPSKALLHTAEIINEAAEFEHQGVTFSKPEIDLDKLRAHKDDVVGKLTGGLKGLAKQRKVTIVKGYGKFTSANTLSVEDDQGATQVISFDHCIIAAGSRVTKLPFIPWNDPRVIDSTGALALAEVPKKMLVVGGGIIGLEMATVYDALGADITVVELSPGLIPGADRDLVRPLEKRIKAKYQNIYLNTKVTAIEPTEEGLLCHFEGAKAPESEMFDRVLVAIGRSPNGLLIDADKAGVQVDQHGFISVDKQMRTNVDHIFAIGDIVGQPMLAHKATHEGKVAAEVIAGHKAYFDARTIPSVAYTDPEVAWMGETEDACKQKGIAYTKGVFPWAASGRSLSRGRNEGMTKVLFDKESGHLIGAGIVGNNAGELIAEAVLALEMNADAHDIGLTIHPHPTLSETLNFAAEVAEGSCTDIYAPKKKR
ncbi:MAG: dihydrolipoyl dehydrogenase [Proteobacteria bacterium]|nr:MAG: dihydrolipoyl dehydrogenase [Pseudomonadota bacterium]